MAKVAASSVLVIAVIDGVTRRGHWCITLLGIRHQTVSECMSI